MAANPTATPNEWDPNGQPRFAQNAAVPLPWDPNQTASGTAGAACSITFTPADADKYVEIWGIEGSYSAAPTGGRISITDGGTLVYDLDITASGPFTIQYLQPRAARGNLLHE